MSEDYVQIITPYRVLRDVPGNGSHPLDGRSKPDDKPETGTSEGGRVLVCTVCRSKITRRDLGMEIEGRHRHVFFNPQGYVFELGCFASARNVIVAGPKTDEFTWFPGFEWQVVGCTGCATQLGWRYTSGSLGGFFGLILANLMEEDDDTS